MNYTIKEQPKKIYEAVTYELEVTDDTGKPYRIRKWEDGNGGGFYILNEENVWVDFYPEEELDEFLNYDVDY